MNERQWWNGRWSRLVRRDVFVRNAADGRWQVELCRGGAAGRRRVRTFGSQPEALTWVEATVFGAEEGWRELPRDEPAEASGGAPKARRRKVDSRRREKVAAELDRAG